MVTNPIGVIFTATALVGTLVIGSAVLLVVLGTSSDFGPEDACENPVTGEVRPVSRDVSHAQTFQNAWDTIAPQLASGQEQVQLSFSESEITSRADEYLEERDAPLDDILICFHDGEAEARGSVDFPGVSGLPLVGDPFEAETRIRGTLDLSGETPRLVVREVEAGTLPGFVEDEARDEIEQAVNERLADLAILYDYQVTFAEGRADVTASARGQPAATAQE